MSANRSMAAAAAAAAGLATFWPAAFAQVATHGPAIDVFADRAPLVDVQGSQAVTVVTREAIEARVAASVPELIEAVAGLHVDRLGNAAGASNVYLRGAEPNHTLVLIDGVRVN